MVQSRCCIFSHDALHCCLSRNSSLENDAREVGHLFCYCRNCKNTLTILLRELAYSATGNSRVHYLKSGYIIQLIKCIPVGHGLYTQFTRPFPFFMRKWVWLARLCMNMVCTFVFMYLYTVQCSIPRLLVTRCVVVHNGRIMEVS